jgi:hypothetical protein
MPSSTPAPVKALLALQKDIQWSFPVVQQQGRTDAYVMCHGLSLMRSSSMICMQSTGVSADGRSIYAKPRLNKGMASINQQTDLVGKEENGDVFVYEIIVAENLFQLVLRKIIQIRDLLSSFQHESPAHLCHAHSDLVCAIHHVNDSLQFIDKS